MAAANTVLRNLTDADRQKVEAWLLDFENSWTPVALGACAAKLPPAGQPLRLPTLVEMVKIDLERQWRNGRPLRIEDYLNSFPELGTPETVAPYLLQAEYEVSRQFGDPATFATFARRFPRQADKLGRLLRRTGAKPAGAAASVTSKRETVAAVASTHSKAQPCLTPTDLPEHFGRYRIVKKLGGGGMGTVYLAEDPDLDRRVALKVPHFAGANPEELRQRFFREARAAAGLTHPSICPVYDVGEEGGTPYFTMAFLEGRPLSDLVADYAKAKKPMPQRWCASVTAKVAQAMAVAHKKEIIHRDLKPSNIMIRQEEGGKTKDTPVIMDFGLARRAQDNRLTGSGQVLGTLPYMPPEAFGDSSAETGPAGDIYTLGVILFELLTGRLPFDAAGWGVAVQIMAGGAPRPTTIRADVDARLETVCLKAMQKAPEERYVSMAEMAAELTDYLRAQGTAGPLASGTRRREDNPPEENPWVNMAEPAASPSRVAARPKVAGKKRRFPPPLLIAIAGAATVLLLVAGIIITIKMKWPDGSSTEIVIDTRPPTAQGKIGGQEVPPETKEVPPPNRTVDLLGKIDLKRDKVREDFRLEKGALRTPEKAYSLLQIPYVPPEEYRLEVVVKREPNGGEDPITLGLVVDTAQVILVLDGRRSTVGGLEHMDEKAFDGNDSTFRGQVLPVGKWRRIVCTVRKNNVRVTCDGGKVIDWTGDAARLWLQPSRKAASDRTLFLESWSVFQVSEITLTPLSGEGSWLDEITLGDRETERRRLRAKADRLVRRSRLGQLSEPARDQVVEDMIACGHEILAGEDPETAKSLAQALQVLAADTKKELLIHRAAFLRDEAALFLDRLGRVLPHREALKANPDDPRANLEVGKYDCLVRNDWASGRPALARGSDPSLKALAALEEGLPVAAPDQAKLGDAWWDYAAKVPREDALPAMHRAKYWYLKALTASNEAERRALAGRVLPRVDGTPSPPVSLRIRVNGFIGFHTLMISNDGVRSLRTHELSAPCELQVNHLRRPGKIEGYANAGPNRLFAGAVDFTTARIVSTWNGVHGGISFRVAPDHLVVDVFQWTAGALDGEIVVAFQANGFSIPDRLSGLWDVNFYGVGQNAGDKPQRIPGGLDKNAKGKLLDHRRLDRIDFRSDKPIFHPTRGPLLSDKLGDGNFFTMIATSEWDLSAGTYELSAFVDDGLHVFIDDQMVLDLWGEAHKEAVKKVKLPAGKRKIRVEYTQVTGPAYLFLSVRRLED